MPATVREFMTEGVEVLTPDASLYDAVRLEMLNRIRHIPIVEADELVGILTDRDVRRATPSALSNNSREDHEQVMQETKVIQLMTADPMTIAPDAPLIEAIDIMIEKRFGALPVVEDKKLVGIISQSDILRAFQKLLKSSS